MIERFLRACGTMLLVVHSIGYGVTASADPLSDFPVRLRHAVPVKNLRDAAVYTINEDAAGTDEEITLQRKVGSDLLIRAWFKWDQAPPVSKWAMEPVDAHKLGELFGGGITCSALYDGENGLSKEQVLDMATRGTDGQLVDAWGITGVRHGSLSSPAYLDYLFRWCKEQIDAGADCLFMDENTAALSDREGYDDRSLSDFRHYLIEDCPQTYGWAPDDRRWTDTLGIPLNNPTLSPTGGMDSFDYRAFLRLEGLQQNPGAPGNRLNPLWQEFRAFRDDRAWKALTDRIRAYSHLRGRPVTISGNGIVKYVDLQVLGVWGLWTVRDGHIDLSTDLIPEWHGLVADGQDAAERDVPVVFFHDWGTGTPPFPWMAVPPFERAVWMRTRGAEIYAAGGFFAFPVHGPFGCDAAADGTLPLIAHLSEFYQQYRDLYLHSLWLGCDSIQTDDPAVSVSSAWVPATDTIAVHVINRDVRSGVLMPHGPIDIQLPASMPLRYADLISPDFVGTRKVLVRSAGEQIEVILPALDAYSVVLLRYRKGPDLSRLVDSLKIRPAALWIRPPRSEFTVDAGGVVEGRSGLGGFLQGNLHPELRNPPAFTVNAAPHASLLVHIGAVATLGARLLFTIDGKTVETVDLPDLDGKNDPAAPEYDRTFTCPIPPGRHRVTVENAGGDWAVVDWYQFDGMR